MREPVKPFDAFFFLGHFFEVHFFMHSRFSVLVFLVRNNFPKQNPVLRVLQKTFSQLVSVASSLPHFLLSGSESIDSPNIISVMGGWKTSAPNLKNGRAFGSPRLHAGRATFSKICFTFLFL
jgi:hypothetical protein